jgi:hypothetical protein
MALIEKKTRYQNYQNTYVNFNNEDDIKNTFT